KTAAHVGKRLPSGRWPADNSFRPALASAAMRTVYHYSAPLVLAGALLFASLTPSAADEGTASGATPGEVLSGLKTFWQKTALPAGSFRPGVDPTYQGMSDSAYSDLAPTVYGVILHKTFGWELPHPAKTREFLLGRQGPDGAFANILGTADPKSAQARAYNTTQGLVALRALGARPRHDPLPVFAAVLEEDYKKMPLYMTSFFPLAYLAAGQEIPPEADRKIRALMAGAQGADRYLHEHVAAPVHA